MSEKTNRRKGNDKVPGCLEVPDGSRSRDLLRYGLSILGFGIERQRCSLELCRDRFRAHYGPCPKAIKTLIALLKEHQSEKEIDIYHLFMALCWLRLYDTEHVMAGRWGFGEKYCRKIVWEYVERVQGLKPILINFNDLSPEVKFAPIDTKHKPCLEFTCTPSSKWWSHKFNGPGVAFEVVCNPVDRGLMLWAAGPYPAGTHDLTILRGGKKGEQKKWKQSALYNNLPDTLRLIGDAAYSGQSDKVSVTMDAHSADTKETFARMKSMQETCFKRFADYEVIDGSFRHGMGTDDKLEKVGMAFDAVAVLIQLDIATEHPLMKP